jgi:hypothetical protein
VIGAARPRARLDRAGVAGIHPSMPRSKSMRRAVALIALALVVLAGPSLAREVTFPAEDRWYFLDGKLPKCDETPVLETLNSRFLHREAEFWKSGLEITTIEEIRETGFRSWGHDFVPRRFCTAQATLNDGRRHELVYQIIEDQAVAGFDWGVTWCMVGLDRHMQYAPACRAARP